MEKEIKDILYSSFDKELDDIDSKRLSDEMEGHPELQDEYNQIHQIRELLSDSSFSSNLDEYTLLNAVQNEILKENLSDENNRIFIQSFKRVIVTCSLAIAAAVVVVYLSSGWPLWPVDANYLPDPDMVVSAVMFNQ